jgi:hypothetical protein
MTVDLPKPDYARNMRIIGLVDAAGLIYSTDYNGGLYIIEFEGMVARKQQIDDLVIVRESGRSSTPCPFRQRETGVTGCPLSRA